MIVQFTSSFDKAFAKLDVSMQEIVMDTIDFFKEHPFHSSLRNHPLGRSMTGKRSISVTDDIRIIFTEQWDYVTVLMLDVGDHLSVYTD